MGKVPLKGINSSADTNEAACFHLLQLWAAMSALDSAACAPSTADHKSCSRNSTNESTENPFPAWHSYWNRTHCETVKIISCIFQSDQMFYSCKIFIARNIVYQDIIREGSQTLSNSVIWCIYDECAGEHSEVQVGVVFFVLLLVLLDGEKGSRKPRNVLDTSRKIKVFRVKSQLWLSWLRPLTPRAMQSPSAR